MVECLLHVCGSATPGGTDVSGGSDVSDEPTYAHSPSVPYLEMDLSEDQCQDTECGNGPVICQK